MKNYHLNPSQVWYEILFNAPLKGLTFFLSVPKSITSVAERFNYRMYTYVFIASMIISATSSLLISEVGSPGVKQTIYSGLIIGFLTYLITRAGYIRLAVYLSAMLAAFSSPIALWYANAPVDRYFTYLLLISVNTLPYLGIFISLREYIGWAIFIAITNTLFLYTIGQYPLSETPYMLDELIMFIIIAFIVGVFVGLRDKHIKQLLQTIAASEELLEKVKSETREEESLLLQARLDDEAKAAFLTSMSHQLRTPLNPIVSFSKFLLDGTVYPLSEKQKLPINRVHTNGKHLLAIINDILDVSNITSGDFVIKISDSTIVDILRDVKLMTDGSFIDSEVDLIFQDVTSDLLTIPLLAVDHQRISQILINIIGNARKFTISGSVTLSVDSLDEGINIKVSDTGPGISEDDYNNIFTAFEQGQAGKIKGGTGLGMPISRAVARAHGGDLTFFSKLGVGTTFILYLPYQGITTRVELE
ncbi:MAG: ATP-binding protein [Phototrophicaceae bacterium]